MYVMRDMKLAGKKNKLPDYFLDSDIKIHRKFGVFYLIVSRKVNINSLLKPAAKLAGRSSCAALDPGFRKMLTVYTPDGRAEVIGTNTTKVLKKRI